VSDLINIHYDKPLLFTSDIKHRYLRHKAVKGTRYHKESDIFFIKPVHLHVLQLQTKATSPQVMLIKKQR